MAPYLNFAKTLNNLLVGNEVEQKNRIKALLAALGLSSKTVSQDHNIQPDAVSKVISGERNTHKVRVAIASTIGLPVDEVFWKNL